MKKNVAGQKIGAQMCSATDGSAFTGSVTVYVTGDAGTQAVGSVGAGACTHEGNGYHTYAPAQAETNYDLVAFTFVGTGAIPATVQVYTSFPQTGDAYAEATNGTYGLSAIETLVDGLETTLGTPAGASVSADIATVAAYVDTEVAAILAAVDTEVAAIKAKTDNLPAAPAATGDIPTAAVIADAVWDEARAGHVAAGSFGEGVASVQGSVTGNVAGSVGSVTGAVGSVTGAVGSVTGNVGGNVVGSVASVTGAVGSVTAAVTVGTNNDKTGYALSAAGVDAVWDEATAGHVTAGTYGVAVTDILTDTAEIGAAGAGLTNINLPDQTMNITGNITGNLSGSVGSVTAGVTVAVGGIVSGANAAAELNAIADAVLDRNMASGVDSGTNSTAVRTPRQALRALRNKVSVAAGTATVTKEDDTTTSWTSAIATTAGNPISSSDPT